MSDTPDPQDRSEEPAAPDPLAAWEAQLEEAAFDETAGRRNSFDTARKKTFLKALAKGATLKEAAKAACVTPQTVYNHQKSDERFAAECRAAAQVLAPVIELAAFERAVVGVEEDVIHHGKHVGTRVKRSDPLLQTLLKGSNPDKYGGGAGAKHKFGKKKWRERERVKLRAEVREEWEQQQEEISEQEGEELRQRILDRLQRMCDQDDAEKIAQGYHRHEETDLMVPPGWAVVRIETLHDPCQIDQSWQSTVAVPFPVPTR